MAIATDTTTATAIATVTVTAIALHKAVLYTNTNQGYISTHTSKLYANMYVMYQHFAA